jgi:hypothetical protein
MNKALLPLPLAYVLSSVPAFAEQTLELKVSGPSEIFSGDPESSSVDARGRVGMGPVVTKLWSSQDAPITALIATERATFAGTAGGGLHRIEAGGAVKRVLEAEKLVVGAITLSGDRLFAATNPDGAILQIEAAGGSKPYFDPTEKYVWAMLDDPKGLIVATGEPGHVLEVAPGGKSRVLLDPGETHIRALVRHPKRGVIAGGGQKGVIYQLKPSGGAFALYDSGMEEVTAFAIDPRTGDLFASFVSESKPGAFIPDKSIGPVATDAAETGSPIKGSEVVRIASSGQVDVLWSSRREGALGLVFDERSRQLYIATGAGSKARGRVYAIDFEDRDRVRLFARVEPSLASAIAISPAGGALIVGTAPSGQVLRIGPGLRAQSVYSSSEQDLQRTARIGRVWFDADVPEGAKVEVRLRTGNTKPHDDTWSDWSAPVTVASGGQIEVPEGRYVQLKAELSASPKGAGPTLKSLHASIQRRNLAPTVEEVFLLRLGVYMRPMPVEEEREKTVTLSTSQVQRLRRADSDEDKEVRVRQGISPGMITVAWKAEDRNKDPLLYRVELRRVENGATWQILDDDLDHQFHTIDSRAFPDGRYQVRVTATDRPANPPSEALVDANISDPFTIDNTAPTIRGLASKPLSSGGLEISLEAEDGVSALGTAEVSINGGPWLMIPATDGLTDARSEKFMLEVKPNDRPGEPKLVKGRQTVAVRVTDEAGNSASASAVLR